MKERMKKPTVIRIVTVFTLIVFYIPCVNAEEVDIPDPGLEAAIREELGIPSGPITNTALAFLTFLDASGRGIKESTGGLTGLEHCVNLTGLWLHENNISDLDPLSGLTNLEVLFLTNNNISNISPLWGLFNLKVLWLSANNISDISPLEGLFSLVDLDLSLNSNISDLGPLSGLTSLQKLYLTDNNISDIGPLEGLFNLMELDLAFNSNISDLSPLSELTNLEVLYLTDNNISDINPLEGLLNLIHLDLGYNYNISNIIPLSVLTNLSYVGLNANNISDLSPLSGLTKLVHLDLADNNISDIQPLVTNTGLGTEDWVILLGNPLSYQAINTDIPTLQARGVTVDFYDRTPTILLKISGDGQNGWPNFTLPEPFVVQVRDENGSVFEGVPITFSILDGGGYVDVGSTKTDLNGFAESTLTLGPSPGVNTVIVAAKEISTYETFTALASYPVIADILYFMDDAVIDERLFGTGSGRSAEGRMNAVYEKLGEADRLIEEELIGEAYGQLREVYRRTDGESRPPDFVAGPAATELAELIQYLADYLIEWPGDIIEN